MDDQQIQAAIEELVTEEQRLLHAHEGEGLDPDEHRRMQELSVQLDQLWDLLRQGRLWAFGREAYGFRHALLGGSYRLRYAFLRAFGVNTGNLLSSVFPGVEASANDTAPAPEAACGSALRRRCLQLFMQRTIPQWLRMEDRMSMAWSVESRLPFMDYRVVEWALRAPDDLKMRDGYGKYILRQSIADLLPTEIAWRRAKVRFSLPIAQWLRGAWRPLIQDTLLSGSPAILRVAERTSLRNAIGKWLQGDDTVLTPTQVWRCLSTEIWLRGMQTALHARA